MVEIEKLKKKIEELENHIFIIDMIDKWTKENEKKYEELQEQLQKAKLLLAEELLKDVK
jgi:hypothetical protein